MATLAGVDFFECLRIIFIIAVTLLNPEELL
jgi:hypothetical protein